MSPNPNWPLMDVAVSFNTGPQSAMPAPYWCSVSKNRTMGQITTTRGRQYELDQVQTGTWSGDLENTDAALDPANTSSPFYPQVIPYRTMRHRAQYPATVNLLTKDQATAFFASRGAVSTAALPTWVSAIGAGPAPVTVVAGVSPSNTYQIAYSSGAAVSGVVFQGWSVQPSTAYSAQAVMHASVAATISETVQLVWINATGGVISFIQATPVSLGTGDVRITVSGTAPANAAGAEIRVVSTTVPGAGVNVLVQKVEVEQAAAPTTFVVPNTWYSIFTGYMERWPQSWEKNGQFGKSSPTAVDAFGYLSQQKMLSAAYEEVLAMGPTFCYTLDESPVEQPSIPQVFYDLASKRNPITILNQPVSPINLLTPGVALTATGGWLPQGLGGPVLDLGNPASIGAVATQSLDLTAGGTLPVGPATTAWTRIIAFRTPRAQNMNNTGATLSQFGTINSNVSRFFVQASYDASGNWGNGNGNGLIVWLYQNGVNTAVAEVNAAQNNNMSDGGWHFLAYGLNGTTSFNAWFDGLPMVTAFSGLLPLGNLTGSVGDTIAGDGSSLNGPAGQVAFVAEVPFLMSSAQVSALYSTFRYGGSGLGVASSTTRYQDILRWGNWAGLQAEDNFTSGETTKYGPATEMNATSADTGTDVVTMLQTVVDTEAGFHYVAADGTVTLKARRARYNQNTPTVIFGENTGAGEIPYKDVKTGYDPTRIANDVTTTQTQTSASQRAVDLTSGSQYGTITLQRTVNTLDPYEQQDAANYLKVRNAQPVQRIEGVQIDVGSNPTVWAAMLALELGVRARVMRRPPLGAATIQVDGFIEQINWTIDDQGGALVDLQISVNNQQQYWQLDSSTFSVLGTTTIVGY